MSVLWEGLQMTYYERIRKVAQTKSEHNRTKLEKYGRSGYFDTDDKGMIPAPDGFDWKPTFDERGLWHGAGRIGRDYRRLLETHPPYVDKYSALAGAFMINASFCRGNTWDPDIDMGDLPQKHKAVRSRLRHRRAASFLPRCGRRRSAARLGRAARQGASLSASVPG